MSYETITYEKRDRVALVTLNRPQVLNAFNATMGRELMDALRQAAEDRGVGCVVLTGAGRAFCSGYDVRDFRRMIEEGGRRELAGDDLFRSVYEFPKPLVAPINGPAVGIGATITLPCDIRLA